MLEGVVSRNRSNVSMDAYIDIDSRRSGHGYVHEKEIFNQLTVLSINLLFTFPMDSHQLPPYEIAKFHLHLYNFSNEPKVQF